MCRVILEYNNLWLGNCDEGEERVKGHKNPEKKVAGEARLPSMLLCGAKRQVGGGYEGVAMAAASVGAERCIIGGGHVKMNEGLE